jgi:hypothetical protein
VSVVCSDLDFWLIRETEKVGTREVEVRRAIRNHRATSHTTQQTAYRFACTTVSTRTDERNRRAKKKMHNAQATVPLDDIARLRWRLPRRTQRLRFPLGDQLILLLINRKEEEEKNKMNTKKRQREWDCERRPAFQHSPFDCVCPRACICIKASAILCPVSCVV